MMLNEPMTSSSQWRIPTVNPGSDERAPFRRVQQARSLVAISARTSVGVISGAAASARRLSAVFFLALLVGGVFAAPAMALFALASLFTPFAAVREIAPTLIGLSLVWLTVAILGAHIQPQRMTRESETDATFDAHK